MNASSVNGSLAADKALAELLVYSGLQYAAVGSVVTVAPAGGGAAGQRLASANSSLTPRFESGMPPATASPSGGSQGQHVAERSLPADTAEVLVTAQKRTERLHDVPVPVTAIRASSLVDTNQVRLRDYYSSVPGLNISQADFGAPQITIRGLTTGGNTNPSVGIVIDDVPYGSSTILGGGWLPVFGPDRLRIPCLPCRRLPYGQHSISGWKGFR